VRLLPGAVRFASWLGIAGAICTSVLSPSSASGQQDATNIRAAYVFNILKYIHWPAGQTEIKIAVLGDGKVASAFFQVINGKNIAGREIRVFRRASETEIASSDVVYFPGQSQEDSGPLLDRLSHGGNHAVLTVGETEQFLRDGGMITLSRSLDHIQLEINADTIRENRVKLGSRLLNIAILKHYRKSRK